MGSESNGKPHHSKHRQSGKPIDMLALGEFDCLQNGQHYRIIQGTIDLFFTVKHKLQAGRRYPVGHFKQGDIIFGLRGAIEATEWQLIVAGPPDTRLEPISWDQLMRELQDKAHEVAAGTALDRWQNQFIHYLRRYELNIPTDGLLSHRIAETQDERLIFNFYQMIYPGLCEAVQAITKQEQEQARHYEKLEQDILKRTYEDTLSILTKVYTVHETSSQDALSACTRHLADFYHITLADEEIKVTDINEVTEATGLQFREIRLDGPWWSSAVSPLLLQTETGQYCVALPRLNSGYELVNLVTRERDRLTARQAKDFKAAWQAYRPLPPNKLQLRNLISFSLFGSQLDIVRLLIVGCLAALLSLATPWFTATIFDYVIPNSALGQMTQILIALIVAALAAGMFELVRAVSMLRLSSKMNLHLEVSLWDRLIRLPAVFFKQYNAGDLAKRAMAASGIRSIISGVIINSVLSGIFSLFSFILLFYYSVKLAFIAVAMTLVLGIFTALISLRQVPYYKKAAEEMGKSTGIVVQLLTGIAKIQASGKERMAFAQWARRNAEVKRNTYQANWLNAGLTSISAIWLPILSIIIFAYISRNQSQLSLGQFLAFSAALGQFTAGMISLSNALSAVIQSIPLLKRALPIIETVPEIHSGKTNPGPLTGKIEAHSLVFHYSPQEPPVLKGVSFTADPGEYIAITGPSGCGKTTLFRLLLGFEQATQGRIYFDDQDISRLNTQKVRQQCGVVLQNSMLMPGSIFDNIVGSALLTLDDAWRAAEYAGLANDIRAMPMGMHTVISERGSTLSGGQRQRLLIARALARNPKILFFDEATSALDNQTQSIIIESLEKMQVTRIVIAHRLSTIQHADKILVMEAGKIIQQGTYEQLMQQPGLFREMARRQLVS